MFGLFTSKYRFRKAAYSVRIRRKPREARAFRMYLEFVEVDYAEGTLSYIFPGTWAKPKARQLNLSAPDNLPEKDLPRVVANLSEALQKLGYEFIIVTTGPTRSGFEVLAKSPAATPDVR